MGLLANLTALEAEYAIIGFLLNPLEKPLDKTQLLQTIDIDNFADPKARIFIDFIKRYEIFNKILLWEKSKNSPKIKAAAIEYYDIENIDDFVTLKEAETYLTIVMDKAEKRDLYYLGKKLQEAMAQGEDQFETALKAQNQLMSLSSKIKLEDNASILKRVLEEKMEDTITTGYDLLDNHIGGYPRGSLITIAGESGHLKTTFALDEAFKMVEKIGILRLVFSRKR